MCQCKFISCSKRTTLVLDVYSKGLCASGCQEVELKSPVLLWDALAGDMGPLLFMPPHHPSLSSQTLDPKSRMPPKALTSRLLSTCCGPEAWHVSFIPSYEVCIILILFDN